MRPFHTSTAPAWEKVAAEGSGGSGGDEGAGCSGATAQPGGGGGEGGSSPLARIQPRVVMVFTCAKCDTRSTKAFSKQSYTRGVVLVRCPGCQKLHLIADHLGWFGEEPFVLHEFIEQQGGNVVRISADPPSDGPLAAAAAAPAGAGDGPTPAGTPATDPAASAFPAQPRPAQAQAEQEGAMTDPGVAARAAAAAVAVGSEGGVFELGSAAQVRRALEEARELQRRSAGTHQPPSKSQQGE